MLTRFRTLGPWLVAAGLPLLPAQNLTRQVEALGDPEHGEAAELELLAAGTKGAAALQELLEALDTSSPRQVARLRAALRVVHLMGEAAAELAPVLQAHANRRHRELHQELLLAVGSLAPYHDTNNQWHSWWSGSSNEDLATRTHNFVLAARLMSRSQAPAGDAAAALRLLERDLMFQREVAAEQLGKLRAKEAIEPLAKRLRERNRPSADAASLTHNGVQIEYPDQFALRAALALTQIAAEDPRSAIGHAVLAVEHPHRSRRMEAVRALASFGPEASDAVDDLMLVAEAADAGLAAEALKILGMLGTAAGQQLRRIDTLASHQNAVVARLAGALATRLRAMGCTVAPEPEDTAPAGPVPAFLQAIATLRESGNSAEKLAAAEALLATDVAVAAPLLLQTLRTAKRPVAEALVEAVGRIGREAEPDIRGPMSYCLASTGDNWTAPRWSASSGGSNLRRCDWMAYAEVTVGIKSTIAGLLPFLGDKNAAVRFVAAQQLSSRAAEFGQLAVDDQLAVTKALLAAIREEHPTQNEFRAGPNRTTTIRFDLSQDIRAVAAVGLLEMELETPLHGELMRAAKSHPEVAVQLRAIARWGPAAATTDLEELAQSPKPEIAAAAAAILAARKADKQQ
jgi:hypothetical protein